MLASLISVVLATVVAVGNPVDAPRPADDVHPEQRVYTLVQGDSGPAVAAVKAALTEAGFRPGDGDEFDRTTLKAVEAFQKYHGLLRDGVFRPEYWDLLTHKPIVRVREDADRIEVDLAKQVLFLVRDNKVEAVVPVSSGNGATYRGRGGSMIRANTPEGEFRFQRQIEGWRRSYLGSLYRPFYFRGGYAIHGSTSVPTEPASHGCVRVTLEDMDFLRQHLEVGMPLYVYGKRTENPAGMQIPGITNASAL